MKRLISALVLGLVIGGCGSSRAPETGYGFRNRSVITFDEITASRSGNASAYDLIQRLRPEYFRSRGPSSLNNLAPVTAVVYVDEVRYGEIESLRTMSADQIREVHYINASDATTRFGSDHVGGAILITTRS
ncbi:MAG: hypothetical protein ACSLFK_09790 [Gemmatimonadaceae bacterium]